MLYGAQEWSIRIAGGKGTKLKALEQVQSACLRQVTGGYKRTPRTALEKETRTAPLDLYIAAITDQRALNIADHSVENKIQNVADAVWRSMRGACYTPRTGTLRERVRAKAKKEPQIRQYLNHAWRERWQASASKHGRRRRPPTTWITPWKQDCRKLYAGLSKAEATALFLMRTEVIGLNAWLAAVQVPGVEAQCPCGEAAQTVRHIILHCTRYERLHLLEQCGTERLDEILSRPASAAHAARWLVATGALEQFKVAREIREEDTALFAPFTNSEDW
jgi:hypothetical protein